MGYQNLGGMIKTLLKTALIMLIVTLPSLVVSICSIISFIAGIGGESLPEMFAVIMLISSLASLVMTFFLPHTLIASMVLTREYILEGYRVGIWEALGEAKERLRGRYWKCYFKGLLLGLLFVVIVLVLLITGVGAIVVYPLMIAYQMTVMAMYYDDYPGVRGFIKTYFPSLIVIGFVMFGVNLAVAIPLLGLLAIPALYLPTLFVVANLE